MPNDPSPFNESLLYHTYNRLAIPSIALCSPWRFKSSYLHTFGFPRRLSEVLFPSICMPAGIWILGAAGQVYKLHIRRMRTQF